MPDRSATAGPAGASRWATTTTERLDRPCLAATTSSSSVPPRMESPGKRTRRTPAGVVKPLETNSCATRSASRASPAEPGRRSGNAAASPRSDARGGGSSGPKARAAWKASGARVVVRGRPGSVSENATTNSATSAGRNAARYTRWSSTPPF